MIKSKVNYRLSALWATAVAATVICQAASKLPENKPQQDLTKVVIEDTKDTYYLGPIGARRWIPRSWRCDSRCW